MERDVFFSRKIDIELFKYFFVVIGGLPFALVYVLMSEYWHISSSLVLLFFAILGVVSGHFLWKYVQKVFSWKIPADFKNISKTASEVSPQREETHSSITPGFVSITAMTAQIVVPIPTQRQVDPYQNDPRNPRDQYQLPIGAYGYRGVVHV